MATYTVTSPQGETYDIDGPPGASDAEVLSQVQTWLASPAGQQHQQQNAAARRQPASDITPMSAGRPGLRPPAEPRILGTDRLSAAARLQQGRQLDSSQDRLSAPPTLGQEMLQNLPGVGALFAKPVSGPAPTEGVDPAPFGSLSDPVSQLAFLLAPHLSRMLGSGGLRPEVPPGQGFPPPRPGTPMSLEELTATKQRLSPEYQPEVGFATPDVPQGPSPSSAPRLLHAGSRPGPQPETPTAPLPSTIAQEVPALEALPGGPSTSPPAQRTGRAALAPQDLTVAPERFQYKLGHSAQGTTGSLSDTEAYNPNLAGALDVWRDPADGQTYVVNGHNRLARAKRADAPAVDVRYLDVPTATEARALGALQNIADNNGTPIDAAKFFRDTGLTADTLRGMGLSLSKEMAGQGLALVNLNPSLFGAVARGDFPLAQAVIIGQKAPEHAQQFAIVKLLEKAKASGKRITQDTVAELADMAAAAPTHTTTEQTLFGAESLTSSLAVEKAELLAYVRGRLEHERKLFGSVGRQGTAEELSRAGNVIDVEQSQGMAQQARDVLAVFDRLKNRKGPLNDAVNTAAEQLAGGARAGIVRERLYNQLLSDFPRLIAGGASASGGGTGAVVGRAAEPAPLGF